MYSTLSGSDDNSNDLYHLIINIAGMPYFRYSPHFESAAAAENPPHVSFGRPRFFLV